MNHSSGHVGQSKISPSVGVSELFVIQAKGMQDSGMQIVHMDTLVNRYTANFIGSSVGNS